VLGELLDFEIRASTRGPNPFPDFGNRHRAQNNQKRTISQVCIA
jgi:hypothetical protein